MSVKYILITVSYGERETEKEEFSGVSDLKEEFEGDDELLGVLLDRGHYDWGGGEYILINLGGYQ